MSVDMLLMFAVAMLALVLGQLGVAGAAFANIVCAVSLAVFFFAARLRGIRKPVV